MPPIAGFSPVRKSARTDATDDASVSSIPAMAPDAVEEMEEVIEDGPAAWANAFSSTLKNDILAGVRETFEGQLKPLKEDVLQLKGKVVAVEDTVRRQGERLTEIEGKLNGDATSCSGNDPSLTKKIEEIETALKEMKTHGSEPANQKSGDKIHELVMGGLQQYSFSGATQFVSRVLGDIAPPIEIYYKKSKPDDP